MLSGNFLIPVDDYNRLAAASGGNVAPLLKKIIVDFIAAGETAQKNTLQAYQPDLAATAKPLKAAAHGLDEPAIQGPLGAIARRHNTYDSTIIAAAVQQYFRDTAAPMPPPAPPSAAARAASKKLRL